MNSQMACLQNYGSCHFQSKAFIFEYWKLILMKEAASHLEKFVPNCSSSSFVIRVNILHP